MQRPGCEPESLVATQRRPVAKKKRGQGWYTGPLWHFTSIGFCLAIGLAPVVCHLHAQGENSLQGPLYNHLPGTRMHWHETRLWRSMRFRRIRWGKLLSAPTQSTAAQRWKIKGWVGSCGPVSNVPIWEMVLSELAREGGEVIWIKVPSHITVDANNAADLLASVGLPMQVRKSHCHVFLGGLDPGQAPLKTFLLMLRLT